LWFIKKSARDVISGRESLVGIGVNEDAIHFQSSGDDPLEAA
jgi:hypothetical protein